jgi:hypothetical protein
LRQTVACRTVACLAIMLAAGCGRAASSAPTALAPLHSMAPAPARSLAAHPTRPTSVASQRAVPALTPGPAPKAEQVGEKAPPLARQRAYFAAAEAVVHRYYWVLNQLHRNMAAARWAAIMTPRCPCRAQVAAVRTAAAHGEHYVDRVHRLWLAPYLDTRTTVDVVATFDAGPGGLVSRSGRRVTHTGAQLAVRRDFYLRQVGRRWLIDQIVALP